MSRVIAIIVVACAMGNAVMAQQSRSEWPTSVLDGKCHALLNGTDIGCPKGAIYSALPNSRHMVYFAANDLAAIGFAGARLQTTGHASSILWADGAYINQQLFFADGQCSFAREPNQGAKLTCKAVLRDGRKLSASVTASEQKDAFMGVEPSDQRKAECEGIFKAHGMLSRAQFQCGFKYSDQMRQKARKCASVVGNAAAKNLVRYGMDTFDRNEQERGHDETCRSVLANFAEFIAK